MLYNNCRSLLFLFASTCTFFAFFVSGSSSGFLIFSFKLSVHVNSLFFVTGPQSIEVIYNFIIVLDIFTNCGHDCVDLAQIIVLLQDTLSDVLDTGPIDFIKVLKSLNLLSGLISNQRVLQVCEIEKLTCMQVKSYDLVWKCSKH